MTGASGHRRVPATFYEDLQIPIPPLAIQRQAVEEYDKICDEYRAAKKVISEYQEKVEDVFVKHEVTA